MKTSMPIGPYSKKISEERAIEIIANAGFDHWDFTMCAPCPADRKNNLVLDCDHPFRKSNYLSFARHLKEVGESCGISCNISHAPFPIFVNGMLDWVKRAIECTAEAGAKICVVHPDNYKSAEENAEIYNELLPLAKACGVKIATENMWDWDPQANRAIFNACATAEDFKKHLDAVNDDSFVACVDIGHAEMMGDMVSARELILALGDKVQCLHIHDNDKWHDSHQMPFTMSIDFDPIVKALHEIDYTGEFTLEPDCYIAGKPEEEYETRTKDLYLSAQRLTRMFEAL